jgi:hypothetical protein
MYVTLFSICYIIEHSFSENGFNGWENYVAGCASSLKDILLNLTYLFCTLTVITIMEGWRTLLLR